MKSIINANAINERLRELLAQSEYRTVKDMCEKNNLSYWTVCKHFAKYVRDEICPEPSIDLLVAYARIFNSPLDYIVLGKGKPLSKEEKDAVLVIAKHYNDALVENKALRKTVEELKKEIGIQEDEDNG